MKTLYKNALLDGELKDILCENGKITKLGKIDGDGIDLGGKKVYAGLVDVHTHGNMGHDTMDGKFLPEISRYLAENGVTSFLPTTMTMDFDLITSVVNIDIPKTDGANIQTDIIIAAHEIEFHFPAIQQPFQILKGIGIRKDLHKIIAAATPVAGDGYIGEACRTGHHFVERAVAAASVDAVFLTAFGGFSCDPVALTGGAGHFDAIVQAAHAANFFNVFAVLLGAVPAAGGGVDDKQMDHFLLSFRVSEVNI